MNDFHQQVEAMADALPLWSIIPFVGILFSIALLPLLAPHLWHRHYKKIAVAWGLVLAVPFLIAFSDLALFKIAEVLLIDYIPFIILLWGLFTVSGGILLRGTLVGTPGLNAILLVIGTLLASWMGTTGASMLLIRPMLRANVARKNKTHIFIFFIFLVSNIGGILTPLGDPPLFLGFIHGVPFFWTMKLLPEFLVLFAIVLGLFYLIDAYLYNREVKAGGHVKVKGKKVPLRLEGAQNFIFLGGILIAVLISGTWRAGEFSIFHIPFTYQNLIRDMGILAMGMLSLRFTSRKLRADNGFGWEPIKEVGFLFFGIFLTIIPVLMILKAGVHGHLGFLIRSVNEPWQYFWMSGGLSSFLDNAPTYLSFFNLALGQVGISEVEAAQVLRHTLDHPQAHNFVQFLKAVSCGSVFMGAMTYIGNAPNFMVRSICEDHNVRMPSFFGYMIWSAAILVPCFLMITWIFF